PNWSSIALAMGSGGSVGRMIDFAGQMFVAPDWAYVPQLLDKMLETIEMTVLGTAIAIVVLE
ncbi:hypothetical protein, partial [Serratia marcescens]|uniref:hypothetical protein n=1 Tax=Serratia marcescens TaxID=615 RepID=UPI001954C982